MEGLWLISNERTFSSKYLFSSNEKLLKENLVITTRFHHVFGKILQVFHRMKWSLPVKYKKKQSLESRMMSEQAVG